ncbi:MAG: DUF4304 domain-containing protein [Armatimonadetes bacterium]|nr:DUF4304 domain-containing protein [Armatimonadota bacterium]
MSYTENFYDSVRAVIAPRLYNIGFRQRDQLVFTRPIGRFVQVIEFASSTPSDERFTVRLGIYVPFAPDVEGDDLGLVGVPGVSRCQVRASLGKILYGKDYIWKTSLAWDETYRQMRDALRGILIHGLGWLAQSSEPAALVRYFARGAARYPDGHKSSSVSPMVMLGLLYEVTSEPGQARRWYRRALSANGPMTPGLRGWLYNRMHNLPTE